MSGWTKLFSSIVTSSIWVEDDATVRVWIAMLASADADGLVEGSIPGFANMARVTTDQMRAAVAKLASPDPDSRTPDYEGRRIEAIEGGWRILNYRAYRDRPQTKDGSKAPAMRASRARLRAAGNTSPEPATAGNALTAAVTCYPEERGEKKEVPIPKSLSVPERDLACGYCGATAEQTGFALEEDHFVPRNAGGTDAPSNLVRACHRCNQAKAGRVFASIDEARRWLHRAYWTTNRERWIAHRPFAFGGQPPADLRAAQIVTCAQADRLVVSHVQADRAGEFLERYQAVYATVNNGATYRMKPARDHAYACDLVKSWPDLDYLDKMAELFLRKPDWRRDYPAQTVGQFLHMAPACDSELRRHGIVPGQRQAS